MKRQTLRQDVPREVKVEWFTWGFLTGVTVVCYLLIYGIPFL